MNEENEPIKVNDKRRFNTDGTEKILDENHEKTTAEPEELKSAEPSPPPFELNFLTFCLSLASSVQIALGLVPNPHTQKIDKNLVSAKQTIDILGILQEKTRGNLDADEEKILGQILYELRMQYVESQGK